MANEEAAYREIEHTADLGIEITAADLPTLFAAAGRALYGMIVDPATIENRQEIKVSATGDNPEDLLHAWLCELLALFNVQGFIGKDCKIDQFSAAQIQGRVSGETLDLKRHGFHTEIKGVTYHDFKVWQEAGAWHARIIFDV
ncbi:MAG TPA: archease [Candidatus Binatia bacterium]|nr:archease [Candidatus Binatia bacterium]